MRNSGNGQHRRPRQAPRFVVTVGATGAGIALPLLAATAAHASSASTWDKVASCESGGTWSANGADGFYGGLALTQGVWDQFGGLDYASSPDLASRQEQIAVAQKVLDAQGPGYWAECGVQAGLAQGGPSPDVDPGTVPSDGATATDPGLLGGLLDSIVTPAATGPATATPAPSVPAGSATASTSAAPSASAVPSAPSASAAATPSAATPSTGRHAKPPAATDGDQGGVVTPSRGAHAAPPAVDPDETGTPAYTVRPGDNLYEIAKKNVVAGGWSALFDANRTVIGADPGLIRPGEQLALG